MNTFLSKFQSLVSFVLTGFDRLRFQGESLLLNHAGGVDSYLYQFKILRKDFPGHCEQLTERLPSETYAQAKREGVPVRHLNSASEDKDTLAQQLAAESKTTRGRIALLSCQEMGMTYRLRKDAEGRYRPRKESVRCTHYYWMAEQSELATDVVFRSAADVARWYPRWIRHSLETLQSDDILQYFGKKRPRQCSDEVRTDFRDRTEGSRIKQWYQSNSVKYYNKEDATHEPIALRVEFT